MKGARSGTLKQPELVRVPRSEMDQPPKKIRWIPKKNKQGSDPVLVGPCRPAIRTPEELEVEPEGPESSAIEAQEEKVEPIQETQLIDR